jgi:5-methylcytosine-specific restriction enzyme B
MKQDEFRKWLVAQGQTDATASSRVSSAKRVEQYLGDLDELFAQEDRDSILNRFAYTAEDERAEHPNPSPVSVDGDLRTGLAGLQQALKLYHSFLTEQTNVPAKAEHQALLDRLTRKEIEAAIRDCDEIGLAAFLERGGYSDGATQFRDDATGRSYPAKATVAAALGHLPEGRAVPMKEFFGGQGGSRTHAVLEKLGYRVERKSRDEYDQAFSRGRIEAAMDAFEAFRSSGAHADAFAGFEEPKTYWVRSTKPRTDRCFATKPIVGYLLGKPANALTGGWSQTRDAAARLHTAGYIIVDQDDVPLPLPEQYAHLMRGAERARLVAFNYFIEPAREAGLPSVTIRAGDLHEMCGLVQNWANVCQALEGEMFQKLASVPAPTRFGPERSTTTEYTFVLAQDEAAKDEIMQHAVQTATTNLILYGPPGTGKTYQTAWEAVRLCLGDAVAVDLTGDKNRDRLMAEYRRLMSEGRIEFVTFHQSISYEEFVEGLRPDTGPNEADFSTNDDARGAGFRLEPAEGVFKTISERARLDHVGQQSAPWLDRGKSVFKLSMIGNNWRPGFDHSIKSDRIYWLFGGRVDWSPPGFEQFEAIKARWQQDHPEATGQHASVSGTWYFRSVMEIGDYVVLTVGKNQAVAVGRIVGPYEYRPDLSAPEVEDTPHTRRVEWLWQDQNGIERAKFYPENFSAFQPLYGMTERVDWDGLEGAIFPKRRDYPTSTARPFVLIIDEINRANISKVFGELITLLEPDKRLGRRDEIQLTLPYSKKRFGVPPNLHIIGTMNTADRSIALLDTALRRRFTFKELMPNPAILSPNVGGINLQKLLATINDRIEYLFDREHQIGHAYFTGCTSLDAVEDVMRHKVIPLLSEYFYEDWSKVAAVLGDGPQGPSRFLEARRLAAPPGIAADDFSGERLRWRVKDAFDFSEFAP